MLQKLCQAAELCLALSAQELISWPLHGPMLQTKTQPVLYKGDRVAEGSRPNTHQLAFLYSAGPRLRPGRNTRAMEECSRNLVQQSKTNKQNRTLTNLLYKTMMNCNFSWSKRGQVSSYTTHSLRAFNMLHTGEGSAQWRIPIIDLHATISSCKQCMQLLRFGYENLRGTNSKLVADWLSHDCFDMWCVCFLLAFTEALLRSEYEPTVHSVKRQSWTLCCVY